MCASDRSRSGGWAFGCFRPSRVYPQNHSRQTDRPKNDSSIRRAPASPRGVRMLFVFKMGFTWGFVTSFSGLLIWFNASTRAVLPAPLPPPPPPTPPTSHSTARQHHFISVRGGERQMWDACFCCQCCWPFVRIKFLAPRNVDTLRNHQHHPNHRHSGNATKPWRIGQVKTCVWKLAVWRRKTI